jgi:hypothetical protein
VDDCRMTWEVFKNCALTLFLEKHMPHFFLAPANAASAPSSSRSSSANKSRHGGSSLSSKPRSGDSSAAPSRDATSPTASPLRCTTSSSSSSSSSSSASSPSSTTSSAVSSSVRSPSSVAVPSVTSKRCQARASPGRLDAERVPVVNELDQAMQGGSPLWICYAGGRTHTPRKITPVRWVLRPMLFDAHCHLSNMTKRFQQAKIVELRRSEWSGSADASEHTSAAGRTAVTAAVARGQAKLEAETSSSSGETDVNTAPADAGRSTPPNEGTTASVESTEDNPVIGNAVEDSGILSQTATEPCWKTFDESAPSTPPHHSIENGN